MFIDTIENLKNKFKIVVLAPNESVECYKKISGIIVEKNLSYDELQEACKKVTPEQLAEIPLIEDKLGINCYEFNINYLLYRKYVSRFGAGHIHAFFNDYIPQRLVLDYAMISKLVKKYNVDYAFYETLDLIDTMIINRMARKGIIKQAFEHMAESLGGEMRLRLSTGQRRDCHKLEYIYNHTKISEESVKWAKKAAAIYDQEKPATPYDSYQAKMGSIIPEITPAKLLDKFKRVRSGDSFVPTLMKISNRIRSTKYFTESLPEGKILSYFLQLTPEASTCSQVPEYADQEYLIEQIAMHGKYGYTIVVKEHPACFGNRLPRFYKELSLLPNVVLLPKSFPTRDLILRSEAVIVATATSPGLESLATGVPVICFGKPFFNICKNTYRCETPEQLWDLLAEISYSEDERIKFLAAMHQATYAHPHFDTPEAHELGTGVGEIMARALEDEIALYESGILK